MIRTAFDILIASNFPLIAITNFNASFMCYGYKLFKVHSLYSLNLSHFCRRVKKAGRGAYEFFWLLGALRADWLIPGGWPTPTHTPGYLAMQPQHLLRTNECYNLINVMKLDIIP